MLLTHTHSRVWTSPAAVPMPSLQTKKYSYSESAKWCLRTSMNVGSFDGLRPAPVLKIQGFKLCPDSTSGLIKLLQLSKALTWHAIIKRAYSSGVTLCTFPYIFRSLDSRVRRCSYLAFRSCIPRRHTAFWSAIQYCL